MICLRLFWEYFKIGLFAVGGGMGTVPFLYDLADKTGWFTHAQLADMLAVAQSVPAAMGVNLATMWVILWAVFPVPSRRCWDWACPLFC